jgi:PKD repeat protein
MRWRFATGQVAGNSSRWYVDDVVLAGSVPAANLAPSIVTAASATPSTVTGNTSLLHTEATDDAGEGNLTYTWTATGDFGASVQFSDNADHSASTTTATFAKAGSYTISVTVRDAEGLSASSDAAVTVVQTATQIAVTPAGASMARGATQQFGAQELDQFGVAMLAQPVFAWSATGGGIDSAGLFTAGNATGNFGITAADGALNGSANGTIAGERLEAWRAAHFSAGEDSGNDADFDSDGLTNLLEYALGTDPRARNAGPAAALVSDHLTLNFLRPRALPDVDYAAQVSGDLTTWTTLPLEVVTDGETQTMRAVDTVPASSAAQRFMRLKATPVP